MIHSKQDYISKCVESGIPVLLEGIAGTGKTTIAKNIAKLHGKEFYAITGTKQTSVNALIGFTSINGVYIPTQFRKAFEEGHYFLIDEIDGMDSNVLLTLNTIENGYMAFPDKVVEIHPEFRLMATANPRSEHSIYTGRSKLDFSTLDRFFAIPLERDPHLELHLTSQEVVDEITIARQVLESNSSSKQLTMRDAIRIYKLKSLGISTSPIEDVVFSDDYIMYTEYTKKAETITKTKAKESMTQSQAKSIDELFEIVTRESTYTSTKESYLTALSWNNIKIGDPVLFIGTSNHRTTGSTYLITKIDGNLVYISNDNEDLTGTSNSVSEWKTIFTLLHRIKSDTSVIPDLHEE